MIGRGTCDREGWLGREILEGRVDKCMSGCGRKGGRIKNCAEEKSSASGDYAGRALDGVETITKFTFHVAIMYIRSGVTTEDSAWL
jgi:hypothetical protein